MTYVKLTPRFFEDKCNREFLKYVDPDTQYELINVGGENFDYKIIVPGANVFVSSINGFIDWGDTIPVRKDEVQE
jgi:hypothetical protein